MKNLSFVMRAASKLLISVGVSLSLLAAVSAEPLKIDYSWPGWVAWEVALEKTLLQKASVGVEFEWFDYVASIKVMEFTPVRLAAVLIG